MKGELIPTMLYADGRPRDVGTDRALANALNVYVDRKSAHQSPMLWSNAYSIDNASFRVIPLFFGTEHMSSTVERFVTIAPFYRSETNGVDITLTFSLSEMWPTYAPSKSDTTPSFPGKYAQASWTTSSNTWSTGADATLSLSVKDPNYGFLFLVISASITTAEAQCYGLAKCIEGVRVIA
jgi:hypothetical protein